MGSLVTVNDGTLTLAILTPKTGTNAWRAIQAVGLTAQVPFFGASGNNLTIDLAYNAAAPATNKQIINWKTMIDTDATGTFSATPVAITLTDERFSVSGTVAVTDFLDLISGTIGFELATRKVDVNLNADPTAEI